MKSDETLRLECLKIAHAHGRETQHVLERAAAFEQYVLNGGPAAATPKPEEG